jgi:hypothetical protein
VAIHGVAGSLEGSRKCRGGFPCTTSAQGLQPQVHNGARARARICLDPKYFPKFYYAKRRFPITSKYRHMHAVLNVDEIKN